MDFISNQNEQIQEMLKTIGVQSIDELFDAIPKQLRLNRPPSDDGLSEYEGLKLLETIANKNTYSLFDNYLGAGAYEHHIPSIIASITSKGEFLSSYTPYQAEASQGMLQAIFEFQSAVCALTGQDVANASLYDGASACAEAVLMSLRTLPERKKVVVAESLHPHYQAVIKQYLHDNFTIETVPFKNDGSLEQNKLLVDEQVACVVLGYPNFFGVIEDFKTIVPKVKAHGAHIILSSNPLVYGLYSSAKEIGADIAVGDLQPLGMPLNYGGPYVGFLSCKQELIRQMPGRLVGETVDTQGRRGFVLTLQAREQHIRREKATSNICTNVALAALAILVGVVWYGKKGIHELALTNYQRTAYLRDQLSKIKGVNVITNAHFFNEFVVSFSRPARDVQESFREAGIEPGVDLTPFYKQLKDHFLVAVTETKSKEQLDKYLKVAGKVAK